MIAVVGRRPYFPDRRRKIYIGSKDIGFEFTDDSDQKKRYFIKGGCWK